MSGVATSPTFGKITYDDKTGQTKISQKVMGIDPGEYLTAIAETREKTLLTKPRHDLESVDKKRTALSELEALVSDYRVLLNRLRGAKEGTNAEGVFSEPTASATTNTSAVAGDLFDLAGDVAPGSFDLKIERLARKDQSLATTDVADKTAALGSSGTITVNGQVINVAGTDSLEDIAENVNAVKDTTKVEAVILKLSDTSYKLTFVSTEDATPIIVSKSLSGINQTAIPDSSGNSAQDLSAKIYFRDMGTAIYRTSNKISDLGDILENGTLILKKADSATTISVKVENDTAKTETEIRDFVKKHNELIDFLKKHQALNEERTGPAEDAYLFESPTLKALLNQLQITLSDRVDWASGSSYGSLREVGINLIEGRKLEIDETVDQVTQRNPLQQALYANYNKVRAVFGFEWNSSDATFKITNHPINWLSHLNSSTQTNNIIVTLSRDGNGDLSATITDDSGTIYPATVTVTGTVAMIKADTYDSLGNASPYRGFELLVKDADQIANSSSRASTITGTQGVVDHMAKVLESMTSKGEYNSATKLMEFKGQFELERDELSDTETRLKEKIDRLEQRIADEKTRMERKFALMQRTLAQALSTASFLQSVMMGPQAA